MKETFITETHLTFTKMCQVTKEEYSVRVEKEDFMKWKALKMYVQDAFPYLSADEREFLLSGITPHEWEECMGGADEFEC